MAYATQSGGGGSSRSRSRSGPYRESLGDRLLREGGERVQKAQQEQQKRMDFFNNNTDLTFPAYAPNHVPKKQEYTHPVYNPNNQGGGAGAFDWFGQQNQGNASTTPWHSSNDSLGSVNDYIAEIQKMMDTEKPMQMPKSTQDYVNRVQNQANQPQSEFQMSSEAQNYVDQMGSILGQPNKPMRMDGPVGDYVNRMRDYLGQQAQGPKMPAQVNLNNFKVEEATIKDLQEKYGFDYSRDYAKKIMEMQTQAQKDEIQASRERQKYKLESAKEDLEHDFFQKYLSQQQDITDTGLNAGVAEDRNIRLDMNRQDALGEILANDQLYNQDLDRNLTRLAKEEIVGTEKMYQERLAQAFEQAQSLTGSRRDYAFRMLDAAMKQREQMSNEIWREHEFNNLSASDRMGMLQNAEQFGLGMAWDQYTFENMSETDKMRMMQQAQEFGMEMSWRQHEFNNLSKSEREKMAQDAAQFGEEMAWRKYQYENMSAEAKARLKADIEQHGIDAAWRRYEFDKSMEFKAGYEGGGGASQTSFSGSSLGSLSHKYESGGNPGAIGYDRVGGKSYGTYQIASRTGTMNSFLSFLGRKYPKYKSSLGSSPGSKSFDSAWKRLAKDKGFANAQHDFIKSSHYDPARKKIEKSTGVNFSKYPKAVHDMLWSVAVQHGTGGANRVFRNAGVRPGMSARQMINAVYNERMAQNGRKYFPSSTSSVRASVVSRFKREKKDALNML